ncbi:hypothetical protein HZ994_05230 [Akkermansiaceae bacterium]|nr:hypothetical protein HZ994_05230 [Akkermansiaceae bacterium]
MKTRNFIACLLLGIGSLQMAGYLTGSKILRGAGLASGISPFPKVFCEADGYEAFAASFRLEGMRDGDPWVMTLTPEIYSRLHGPYNRRNVYGASLAFAPRLPMELRENLFAQSLSPGSAMRSELGIPADVNGLKVIVTPRDGESHGPWIYEIQTNSANP